MATIENQALRLALPDRLETARLILRAPGSCGPNKGVEIASYLFASAENANVQSA